MNSIRLQVERDFMREGQNLNPYIKDTILWEAYEMAYEAEVDDWLIENHAEQEGEHGHNKTI